MQTWNCTQWIQRHHNLLGSWLINSTLSFQTFVIVSSTYLHILRSKLKSCYMHGKSDICSLLKQLTKWARIRLCWYRCLEGFKPKASEVALAMAKTPQSLDPTCFWHWIIFTLGTTLLHTKRRSTHCSDSLSRTRKRESNSDFVLTTSNSCSYNPVFSSHTVSNLNPVL